MVCRARAFTREAARGGAGIPHLDSKQSCIQLRVGARRRCCAGAAARVRARGEGGGACRLGDV
ncbi:hypothetical protein EON67_05915 [archaeon]|nr:MAG: hypothetical protein EON67_05915 [archaeon]